MGYALAFIAAGVAGLVIDVPLTDFQRTGVEIGFIAACASLATMTGNNRFADFDRFIGEAYRTPISIRLFGKKWELPGEAPATTILKAQRFRAQAVEIAKDPQRELTEAEVEELSPMLSYDFETALRELIGHEIADEWLDKLSYEGLQAVFWRLIALYEGASADEGDESEPAPFDHQGSPIRISSNAGAPSKPTSPGSTILTSPGKSIR